MIPQILIGKLKPGVTQTTCRGTIFNFAEAYAKIAGEQHGGHPIPERLPTEREVGELLSNVNYLKQNLENLREIVQHSIQTEKAREGGRPKGIYDGDDDVSMYGDGMKQPYGIGEVKKRRGDRYAGVAKGT
ncbi:putative gata-type sexual development transcription factor protein [Eutypa lata UCREL1]|uniref:Putative gata-type sexual development transcription factor protein n=1 Tax=Eutypa lata (strain UCR-EL1) TaxID=1287681 RepID=M7SYV2_EUTLA|nr:putative gata-type sexual development transcription factor protein [Eutypa lata UCREL1]